MLLAVTARPGTQGAGELHSTPRTAPVCPMKGISVSSLALLVLLLLALVVLQAMAGVGYLVHRHPSLGTPLLAAVATAAAIAAFASPIATR